MNARATSGTLVTTLIKTTSLPITSIERLAYSEEYKMAYLISSALAFDIYSEILLATGHTWSIIVWLCSETMMQYVTDKLSNYILKEIGRSLFKRAV